MILGLLSKSWREAWVATALFGVALFLTEVLLGRIIPQMQEGFINSVMVQLPFVRTMFAGLLGSDLGEEIGPRMLQAILWVHPIVLTIPWAHEMILCTRLPAAEIDRGTIDVLLGLPVSRRAAYLSETIVWLASGAIIMAMAIAGHLVAARGMAPEHRLPLPLVLAVVANMYCLYVAVGGIALLVSALSDRRGRAIAIVFSIVMASFLLNFLVQFWAPARHVDFLGLLNYYQPARVLMEGVLPAGDVLVLLGVGAVTWTAGGEVLRRRSICTV